ncbi:GIY-YIG catalytic domain-containing protein [Microdochium bolleyi]|uniref:GIY-YIG catalytic domain-containing protein n=1 Tax=Microdochium bolleyi TaxID=196109 RepID=A0A136J8C9_9PEZI|nr:GIY-YIG catalytic domain-containing protein [Microdochium bolleyi]
MTTQTRPIPPLYTVYILRSTVRHSSLYIGSTPNPPRRLKQHNGEAKGGAVRTSRPSLRPWEMVGLVSGFPGLVAALKFEWALNNPHLSLHIPSSSRLTIATQKKRSGQPRRPPHSLTSILSNTHLLLRVPSFARWPLTMHFFAKDVHAAWGRWCKKANEPLPAMISVLTDFEPPAAAIGDAATAKTTASVSGDEEATATTQSTAEPPESPAWGVHALPTDYTPLRDYVTKTNALFTFENEGPCVICKETLPPGEGLYAVCPNQDCQAAGHVSCWSGHMLRSEHERVDGGDPQHILPVLGRCPSCDGEARWVDMMKELSLRVRGPKEVEKLLKKPRKPRKKKEVVQVSP